MIVVANCLRAPRDLGAWIEQMFGLVPPTIDGVSGFRELHLRKVEPEETDCVYVDLTVWEDRSFFEDWRISKAFEDAHAQAREHHEKFRLLHPLRYIFDISLSLDVELLDSLLTERLSKDYPRGVSPHSRFHEVLAIVPDVSSLR